MKIEEGRKGMEGETSNIERPTSNIERGKEQAGCLRYGPRDAGATGDKESRTRTILWMDYDIDIGAVKRTHRGVISP
jgi:hypothetical protein